MLRKTAVPVMAAAAVLAGLAGVALSQSWNSKTYTDRACDSAGAASASAAAATSPEVPPPAGPSGAAPSSTALPPGMSTAAVTAQAEEKVAEMKSAEEESWSEEEGIGYDPKGRRDPFKPLVGSTQMETEERGKLPGIAGISVREVKLIGIAVDEEQKVAIFFGGPDQEGYFVREGQSFYDGTVNKIDPDGRMVIIRTKIDDPRSLVEVP